MFQRREREEEGEEKKRGILGRGKCVKKEQSMLVCQRVMWFFYIWGRLRELGFKKVNWGQVVEGFNWQAKWFGIYHVDNWEFSAKMATVALEEKSSIISVHLS